MELLVFSFVVSDEERPLLGVIKWMAQNVFPPSGSAIINSASGCFGDFAHCAFGLFTEMVSDEPQSGHLKLKYQCVPALLMV